MPLLIVALVVTAVLVGAWAASTTIESRREVQRSIEAVGRYGGARVRDQEMLENIGERVLAPVGRGLLSLAHAFTPAGYVQALKQKIVLAGSPPGYESDRLLVLKVIGAGSALVWIALFFVVLGLSGMLPLVLVAAASAFAFFGPDLALQQRIKDRRRRIERALPDTLDLLVISVEAGLGFEQAVDRTAGAVPGPLSEEFRRMLQETRMGASRSDALRALDERTQVDDLRTFILAMLQADTFGISIARILKAQADEMRLRRRQHAQETAQKAPIKMLFPMVTCIFPAIFVVVLVPAMLRISDAL